MRAADLGLKIGTFERGAANTITDVAGVRVGHTTLSGGDIRSGVTAIVPDQLTAQRRMLPAGLFVGNGYGKLTGSTQLLELGAIETPIVLTSTLSAFRAADALLGYMLQRPGYEDVTSLNPVVGETNDGLLSDIRSRPVSAEHVLQALNSASTGPVAEGCVGAGAGTTALGYKAGIGTSSRRLSFGGQDFTVGVLVQSNFTGTLTACGVGLPAAELLATPPAETVGNSCMIVVATDAPVDARQLGRVAKRSLFAMARVGADFAHGSGDYALSFSTATAPPLPDGDLNPLFAATMDATEEALLNSVFQATDTVGFRGRMALAVPLDKVRLRLDQSAMVATGKDSAAGTL